ncbi:secretion protein EspD [Mycobacterium ahvazicum]|uniref:secretion protein EspD n=1 Tax=Mycobacterium ahvazicum TaxID=1964395 RepID=UPI000BB8F110|nr:secretion protein EspD [Mycobacterium ahvazicum]
MDTTQHGHGDDGNYAAWDFGDNPAPDSGDGFGQESGAFLDFGDGVDAAEPSVIDSLVVSEPAPPLHTGDELIDALAENDGDPDAAGAEDDDAVPTAKVTNPPETVSVTATMDGRVSLVELSADAAKMTESGLAAEIFAIADLARQRALSIQHSFVLDAFRHLGITDQEDEEFIAEALETGVTQLRSPDQAIRAQADVFATRYGND